MASLFVLGAGVVGREVLEQVSALPPQTRPPFIGLRVVAVVTRRGGAFDVRGIDRGVMAELVATRASRASGGNATSAAIVPSNAPNLLELPARTTHLDALARLTDTVLVDCTAADGMEDVYEEALSRGLHVVTANKKPLAARRERVEKLFAAAARTGASFRYEATVGAGLPVIGTLQGLVRTGDRIRSIECALSGTLGFITNELARGVPLSAAVAAARARGYTEPDPRHDLAGTDVARKAVIVARELGIPLEIEDVALSPLIPHDVLDEGDDLDASLRRLDADFARRTEELRARGKKLVYLAEIRVGDPRSGKNDAEVIVGPREVPLDHPAASLGGSDALVAITSERYPDAPLIVRGAGAGGPVTATAVLSDVFLCLPSAANDRSSRHGAD
jgi:aspartokinase/homoserine dehydrogenase 1